MKTRNILLLFAMMLIAMAASGKSKKENPALVIITAGQSNTDGRVMNDLLPDYIKRYGYNHCKWTYGTSDSVHVKPFTPFVPRMGSKNRPDRWAYDAVTYYNIDKATDRDFYVIKWSHGGTAIDTACTSSNRMYWSADPGWLATNKSTLDGGKSLLKSFTEQIAKCIDTKLSKLPEGYEIGAFLWHQGESDKKAERRYYDNLKGVVKYVRTFLVKKTGNKRYKKLPFICGTVARSNKRYSKTIEDAMYKLASEDKNFYVVDMADAELQQDQLHFTAKSAEYLGKQMYNKLVELGVVEKDPLEGKTIGVIGDSYVRNHRDSIQNTWHYKFAQKHGMTYYNYGRNGNCITVDLKKWGKSILSRYNDMKDSLDYVVVIAGHNDCNHIDSIGVDTFSSRLDSLCHGLKAKYPQSKIIFFTPWTCKDYAGSSREKVVNAMIKVCGDNNIPIFDSAHDSGIHAESDEFRSKYFQGGGKRDYAHLNAKGHDLFLPVAEKFLMTQVRK